MNETTLWELIEKTKRGSGGDSEKQVSLLEEALGVYSPEEIIEFDRVFHEQMGRSYRRDLWAAAYIINGGCSDDGFDYFRAWLIAQGKEVFERALANPESLTETAEPEVELELIMYAAIKAYEKKTGGEFPYPPRPRVELTGDAWEETEECLQKKFPTLFERFWNSESSDGTAEEMDISSALAALQGLGGLFGGGDASSPEALYTQAAFLMMDETPENAKKAAEMLTQAAEQGHAGAQHLLGTCYQEGNGVAQDHASALKWFRAAAEQGHGDACGSLGLLYQEGMGVPVDYAEAKKWYLQAIEADSAEGAYGLAVLFNEGLGVETNLKEAAKWYRKAAEDGHEVAANCLGVALVNGLGVKADPAEAAKWFAQAAEAGFAEAQYNSGVMHEQGNGVARDFAKAAELYQAAADQGNAKAKLNLGMLHANGTGVTQDDTKAAELYREAAEQGNMVAASNLAILYQHGRGVPQDHAEAVRWCRQSAEAGERVGEFNLGTFYQRGIGVPQDFVEALRWYRLAAAKGFAAAENNIGDFYETGRGVAQDFVESAKWYRRAAEKGIGVAQLCLGEFYRKGQGVPQDFKEAEKWLKLAAAQNLELASQRLEEMYQAGEARRAIARKAKTTTRAVKKQPVKKAAAKTKSSAKPGEVVAAPVAMRRALCLRALIRRCEIEGLLLANKQQKKATGISERKALIDEAKELNAWLKDEGLRESLSKVEREALKKVPGSWTVRELKDYGWRTEALGVVAWAIGLVAKVPPYDQQWNPKPLFKAVPILQPTKKFIAQAKLRNAAKILKAREVAENWLWRARTTQVQKEPERYPPPAGWTYEKIITAAAKHWEKEGLFKALKGDYPALGKPYRKLSEEEWQSCRSIATERLYGLNWVCSYAADWDRVPTGT